MGDQHQVEAEAEDRPPAGFARGRHAAYMQAMASELPRSYATQEVMHLTLAYFAVAGLSFLRALDWVLDAPSLQDDFYLNLVDRSSQNMLAIGLGICVYLWSASSSKVTKLCDLGPRDNVCAMHWTREGSYLALAPALETSRFWNTANGNMLNSIDTNSQEL